MIAVVPETLATAAPSRRPSRGRVRREQLTRRSVVAVIEVFAASAAAVAALLLGVADGSDGDAVARVGIVLSQDPASSPLSAQYNDGLVRAARDLELETETLLVDDVNPDRASLDRVRARLDQGDLDLVVWAGYGASADALVDLVRENTDTHFVYVDADVEGSRSKTPRTSRLCGSTASRLRSSPVTSAA